FAFAAIIFRLSPIILSFLMLTVLISYFIMVQAKNYERSRKDNIAKEERESHYASSTLSDFQFGKDIRVYGLKKLLLSKKQESNKRMLRIIKDVQDYIFRASLLDTLLIFLREVIIY